jgi:hypothetical protein
MRGKTVFLMMGIVAGVWMGVGAPAAAADWSWEQAETVTLELGDTVKTLSQGRSTFTVKNNLLRLDDAGLGGARIFNFQNRQVLILNFRAKAFFLVPLEQLIREKREERAGVKAGLEQRAAEAASLPGEEGEVLRAQVEAQKKKYELWERPYQVRPTGDKANILGHVCEKYEGLAGEEVFQELWVAEDLPLGTDFHRYISAGLNDLDSQQYSYFGRLPGFPLKVINRYGPVSVREEVLRISTTPSPVDAFLIPDDFRETEMKVQPGR